MKTGRKIYVLMLALLLAAATMLSACGGSSTDYSALQGDVVKGSSVFVDQSDVVFFGYDNMLCSALFKDGEVYDFVVEAGFTGDVYALAIYDGAIYISASDGFFRYDLDIFSNHGNADHDVLWENNLSRYNSFQIYDGRIFFLYGVDLCYIPADGGAETGIASEVVDFEVTSEGIFYSSKDGELHLISPDLKDDKVCGEMAAADLSLGRDGIYYKDNGALKCISPDSGKVRDISTGAELGEYTYPWINGGTIAYSDDDYNYYLLTGKDENAAGEMMDFPQKHMGYVYKDWLVSQTEYYGNLDVLSFTDGTLRSYDLKSELAEDISRGQDGSGQQGGSTGGSAGNYDLIEGMQTVTSSDGSIEYIYFNDFMMTMPNNEKWSMETSPRAVTFYLFSAQQEGFGGKLVSIAAYDIDDDTYKSIPNYREAGITANTNKRLVAIYPTDVQWNHDDPAQEADYKDLQTYLEKIGAGAVNSPLQTGDSD